MLYEVLGDIWVVRRNPYLEDDLLENPSAPTLLIEALRSSARARSSVAASAPTLRATRKVGALLDAARAAVRTLRDVVRGPERLRRRALRALGAAHARDNICFDAFARVSHVTDATDWRVEYPFVVLRPMTRPKCPALVRACIELGLTVIPRGGGTGYTGSAVPLTPHCRGHQHREARADRRG